METEQENIVQCENCRCEIDTNTDDFQEYGGEIHCQDCFDDLFFYCNNCQEYYPQDEFTEIDGNYICESCLDANYCQCEDCSDYVYRNNSYYIESSDSHVCESCYQNYFYCESCGVDYHSDYYGGDGLCQDCYCDNGLHDYSYKPDAEFYGESNNGLYFGIELECESNGNYIESVVDNLPSFVYAKSDSSLDNGFEIVSHPASWQWLQENKDKWNSILSIRQDGFTSYNTNTCGIHIHMSKSAFSGLHLYKFLKMFYENPSFILTISRRRKHNLEQYASLEKDESIVYKARTKSNGNTSRYTAVNLENYNTVEIRIFRGTLAESGFWRNIEFCKSVFEYTKTASVKDISVNKFCGYIEQNKIDYPNLYEFLDKKGFMKTLVN